MNFKSGTRIKVKPLIFYPKGVNTDKAWHGRWKTYHTVAREKYKAMLKGRDTFELSSVISFHGEFTAKEYGDFCFSFDGVKHPSQLARKEGCSRGVETMLAEILLNHPEINQYTRYTLPYCLSILFMDPDHEWVGGGGRNLNGDLNLGGGILVIPNWQFDEDKLMSTLLHELGHSFGLPHCWQRPVENKKLKSCYYAEKTSRSVMSYNKKNWTNSTELQDIPGCLLGDEIDALSQNINVFPDLTFNKNTDFDCPPFGLRCPQHDKESHPLHFGPMHLFFCTTKTPSNFNTTHATLNDHPSRWILPSHSAIGFVQDHMWHSPEVNAEGWVSIDVTFPVPVTLNRMMIYTEYGGNMHKANMIQIEAQKFDTNFHFIKRIPSPNPATEIIFNVTKAAIWRLSFHAGSTNHVVIRGLRFFANDLELFPPLGPSASTTFGDSQGSQVSNLVEIQRIIRANAGAADFDSKSMWMSGKVNEANWVSIEIIFPVEVQLDKLRLYSFSIHTPNRIQLEVANSTGQYNLVKRSNVSGAEFDFTFNKTKGKVWKIAFEGKENGFIIVRGLRFFIGNEEFYPPARVE